MDSPERAANPIVEPATHSGDLRRNTYDALKSLFKDLALAGPTLLCLKPSRLHTALSRTLEGTFAFTRDQWIR